ncbi:serine hydrolase domain-containing protein [Portibacter lacus]|uniref:Serine hydrolase n=1 Tax=Portibacter lacus TaxID=1099794 RepID=A0AA37SR07_9BACT|nr:serine hydrolase domain-containing protein [Portibacter lacus]GLR18385.1 serine hydrolase [Portibacter lacus]
MTRYIYFLLLLFPISLTSQSASKASKTEGFSTERLERITNMLTSEIENQHIPGAVALISRNGKIVYLESFGNADAEGKPLKKDAIFRIASQTKAITSTAVMMLWEEAKFKLDDPISKYIPEFKNPKVLKSFHYNDTTYTSTPAKREITIRDLLTHQSGLGYGIIDGDERMKMIYKKTGITDLFTTKNITIKESVLKLAQLPLHHNPGEKYTYSEGLDVLAYFIEIISGMPVDEFMRTRIFEPLDMQDTYFYIPDSKKDRLVAIQHKNNGTWENFPTTFYDPDYPIKGAKTFFSGGAGLSSTAEDYAKFLQMYLNNGKSNGVRILSRTTINMMMQNQSSDLWAGTGRHYGLAFGVIDEVGLKKGGSGGIGTFDWGGYFNTQYFADPKEEVIGVLMKQTQGNTGDQTSWKFRQLVFSAIDD